MFWVRQVRGDSMVPVLKPDRLVVVSEKTRFEVGDIVMIRRDGLEKIKRITRLRGDTIYVEGDNPAASTDSRHFGWIAKSSVQGTIIWPRNLQNRSYRK
jgi:nickel-type superoxide dismutase maturation protease